MTTIEPAEIQGLVAGGNRHPLARYLLFTFAGGSAARSFLQKLPSPTAASALATHPQPSTTVTVGISHPGLRAAQLLSPEDLDRFPLDFQRGPTRERLHEENEIWWNGVAVEDLHCLVVVHALTAELADATTREVRDAATRSGTVEVLVTRDGASIDGAVLSPPFNVHFGYRDSVSGPSVRWSDDSASDPDAVDFRHFVLGHSNNEVPSLMTGSGAAEDFVRNGTFGAFRLMYQDVAQFNAFLARYAPSLALRLGVSEPEAKEWLAAKLMGRRRDGQPLAHPIGPPPVLAEVPRNDFDYGSDPRGTTTPLSSHIRVTNPRAQTLTPPHVPVPKLLRRGRPYGKAMPDDVTVDDGVDRGVAGMFLCVSLAGQFEKIVDWIHKNNFSHAFQNFRSQDALLGNRDLDGASREFVIAMESGGDIVLDDMPTFVRGRGAAYFLFPSMKTLAALRG